MSELDCLRCNDQPSSKILISSCSSLPVFRDELNDSSGTLFFPLSFYFPSSITSPLNFTFVSHSKGPRQFLDLSTPLSVYFQSRVQVMQHLSKLGKGGTDFWMTDLLRSLENDFSREIKD